MSGFAKGPLYGHLTVKHVSFHNISARFSSLRLVELMTSFTPLDGDDGPAPVHQGQVVITVLYDDDWIGSISEGGISMSSVDGRDTE